MELIVNVLLIIGALVTFGLLFRYNFKKYNTNEEMAKKVDLPEEELKKL